MKKIKGNVYFEDGHVEMIKDFRFVNDRVYRFSTSSGDYLYMKETFKRVKIVKDSCGGTRTTIVPARIIKVSLEIRGGKC